MELSTSTNIFFNRPNNKKLPISQSIKKCGEIGYRVMDLNFLDATTFKTDFTTDKWEYWLDELATTAKDSNVDIRQAHAPVFNFLTASDEEKKYYNRLMERAIECSSRLGVNWIVFHPETAHSEQSTKDSIEGNYDYYQRLNEIAEQAGVGIALENMWEYNLAPKRKFATTSEELITLVDKLDSSNIGICWDFVHGGIMQQDQEAALNLIGNRLTTVHVSDYIGSGLEANHLLPFDGEIEWRPLMEKLKEIQYRGDLTYEIHRFTQQVPEELIDDVLRYSITVGNYLISLVKTED